MSADRFADVLLSLVCVGMATLGIAGLGTADLHGARGVGRVALGGVWITYWCWILAAIWSGLMDMQSGRR